MDMLEEYFHGPPASQPSLHTQPPPHNPNKMMGPHNQCSSHCEETLTVKVQHHCEEKLGKIQRFFVKASNLGCMKIVQPFMSPRYAGGPRPPIRMGSQPPGGVPGAQPLLPNALDPTRQQEHPGMGGPMQRMNPPPRGMGPMGQQSDPWLLLQSYGGSMRPPPNSIGPGMAGMNMGPGAGRPWPNPSNANSIPYSPSSPGTYGGPPGGGGPPGTPIMPSPAGTASLSHYSSVIILNTC
ncbi:single-stranded DNA-binding protein 3-like [Leucoraja erinacea]|uniref:single-stranded DNA-binding protein 3-like n=1 Tax=Leucoraja erinaceus TaxID=7782 RepID=UPI00245527DD|nr:single-stranded DNA-binding protein 3-like [Leucoraja erinacea]